MRCNLPTAFIGPLERGQREPSVRSLRAIAAALHLRLVDLVAEEKGRDDGLLAELRREVGALPPGQQRDLIEVVRRVVRLAGSRRR